MAEPATSPHEVLPLVARAGTRARFRVRPAGGGPAQGGSSCRVSVTPTEGWPEGGSRPRTFDAVLRDGAFELDCDLPTEQEYVLGFPDRPAPRGPSRPGPRLYALEADLFARPAWKADLHLHSNRSDGADEPAHVPLACRLIGMDLVALTDHRQYAPSLEARRAFEGCPTGLTILAGEEVHPPDTETHIVHVGGSESINALFDCEEYRRGVASLAAGPAGNDRALASCLWCFDRIRAAGGVGILAHPYWLTNQAFNVPEALLAELLARRPFDALELIGGYHREEAEANALQVARWQEERSRGREVAVVGSSDAHGCERGELFGWYWTMFFASEPTANTFFSPLAFM